MNVTEKVVGQVVFLAMSGQLVFNQRKIYQQAIQDAKAKSPRKIALDLEGLTYMDSAGLGLLALTFEQAKVENIALCLIKPTGVVKRILEMTQLPKIIPMFENESQALNSASSVLTLTK